MKNAWLLLRGALSLVCTISIPVRIFSRKSRSESSLFLAGARSAGHESDGQLREELEKRLVGEHALVAAVEIRQPRRVREAPQRPTSPSSNAYIDGSAVSTKAFRLVY